MLELPRRAARGGPLFSELYRHWKQDCVSIGALSRIVTQQRPLVGRDSQTPGMMELTARIILSSLQETTR